MKVIVVVLAYHFKENIFIFDHTYLANSEEDILKQLPYDKICEERKRLIKVECRIIDADTGKQLGTINQYDNREVKWKQVCKKCGSCAYMCNLCFPDYKNGNYNTATELEHPMCLKCANEVELELERNGKPLKA